MRIFVYEYTCGGGLMGQPLPESLQREGWAMLEAVLDDFRRCQGVRTVMLLDPRLAWRFPKRPGMQLDYAEPGAEAALFRDRARDADFTLVIAPEFDDILYERCRWTEEVGGRLLGPSAAAVRVAGDKLQLAALWQRHDIPTPRTQPLMDATPQLSYPLVCKPRHGAGSQANFLVQNADELRDALRRAAGMGIRDEFVVQPPVNGTATSVSFLLGSGRRIALPAAQQILTEDGRFRYLGGYLPLPAALDGRAKALACRAIGPVEGLSGYVGVDLILGEAPDGSRDAVIEVNPRLTTSYVGLRRLAKFNLAEALFALATERPTPDIAWREGFLMFRPGGMTGPRI